MGAGRTAIIVAGMHRSGTSVTTRIINLLGAELGGNLIPAGVGNERGHWESKAVQALHNRMLAELGSDIYSPVNFSPDWFGSAAAQPWIARIRDLVATEYAQSELFVLKDPRIALFVPLWLEALGTLEIEPCFVLPFRHPDAVAESLERREARLGSGDALPHAQGVAVWLRYVLAAEEFTRGAARSFVAYDSVLADWRTQFARIGRQLRIEWPQWQRADAQIDAFLDPGPGARDAARPAGAVEGICRSVYASLERAVLEPHAVSSAFDAAAQMLADAERVLGPHITARERVYADLRTRMDTAAREHERERADMHRAFAAEIAARDDRVAAATEHARSLEQTLAQIERERSTAVDYARSLEQARDQAVDAGVQQHIAADLAARDAQLAQAAAQVQALHDTVARLESERANALAQAQALAQEHARAAAYAESLERSRAEALDYAATLENARREAAQQTHATLRQRNAVPVFFTIASRNYLAYALTLMESVAQQHPDALRYLILADRGEDDPALAAAPFATIPAAALALPAFESFAFRYTIMEFNTAIKPYAFAYLRGLHPDSGIVYLDPDILVVEPLAQVEAAFAGGALAVLTPHLLAPVDDGLHPDERAILRSGAYNCGFIAIGAHAQADALIAWWAQRLEFGAYNDVAAGLFTDQKWIDLVPGLFPDVHVLRDEGYNVAYWNLSQRPVVQHASVWYAGRRPLAFVHFSGVDLERPEQFSKHQNRHTQETIGGLAPLYAHYLARLAANGHAEHRLKPYAFGHFADGEPICDAVRAVFRRWFDRGAPQAQRDPYTMDRALYDLPCDELPHLADAPVTRVMYAVWAMRVDLQRAFDLNTLEGRKGYLGWFTSTAGREMGIPQRHLAPTVGAADAAPPDAAPAAAPAGRTPLRELGALCLDVLDWTCRSRLARELYALIPERTRNGVRRRLERVAGRPAPDAAPGHPSGINLVGYAHGEFGVAEILRKHAYTLERSGMPFVVRNFDVGVASRQSDRSMQDFLSEECRYDVNLFCINADQMPVARAHLGDAVFAGRYNIGCWFWELEKFPAQWHGATELVDEIWVTSPFVRDAIAACTHKPVHIVPVALGVDLPRRYTRAEFGLPEDAFVFLFSFDFNSFVTRKNAEGVIAAFRRAFGAQRSDVRLVIKTINGERFPAALASLTDAAGGDARIEVRDGFLDRVGMWALQACCDCYVSLHRSEGLGLGMAECMLLGKPVVATAYSGNLAFMDADNSCLVDYALVPVEEGEYPAWEGQHWAEPDIEQAAQYLRRLADDPDYARALGERAQASVRERLSAAASIEAMQARLAQIRSRGQGSAQGLAG